MGRAGVEDLQVDKVSININGCEIVKEGGRSSDYTEEAGQVAMSPSEIHIQVDLGAGDCFRYGVDNGLLSRLRYD